GVRVRAEHARVTGKSDLRGCQVSRLLAAVLVLQKEADLRVRHGRFAEDVVDDEEVRIRRPGEIVNALLAKAVEDAVARKAPLLDPDTGRAHFAPIARGGVG